MCLIQQIQSPALKNLARPTHRKLWGFLLALLMICSVIVLWIWIHRYLENPTYIVQVESSRIERPFPSVVVCPEVAFASHKIEPFLERLKYPIGLNISYTRNVIQQLAAFFSPDVFYKTVDLENIETILDYNGIDIETAGLNLTGSCEEAITRCRWQRLNVRCSTVFEMTLTSYGFCCVFNGRSLKREMSQIKAKIERPALEMHKNSGFTNGLMLVINQTQASPFDVDISYKWLSIHGAQRYIDLPRNGTPIAPGTEVFASYSTVALQVDEEAVNLNKNLRHCRMGYESLKYFPVYHKKYCLMEREMKRTIELCDCLRISHIKLPGIPVCRARSLHCARGATVSIGNYDFECPITCDAELDRIIHQTYDLDPSTIPYDTFYDGLDFKKITIVRIYEWNRNRKIVTRKSYFTRFQLFAQLGGVFNVFFGCSVLSILELITILWHSFKTRVSAHSVA